MERLKLSDTNDLSIPIVRAEQSIRNAQEKLYPIRTSPPAFPQHNSYLREVVCTNPAGMTLPVPGKPEKPGRAIARAAQNSSEQHN